MASLLRSSSLSTIPPPSNPSSLLTSPSNHAIASYEVESVGEFNQTGILGQDGIGLDDSPLGISSTSIPSHVHISLLDKDVSQVKIKSLLSSPTKAALCRNIEELKAKILMMKDTNKERCKTCAENQPTTSLMEPADDFGSGRYCPQHTVHQVSTCLEPHGLIQTIPGMPPITEPTDNPATNVCPSPSFPNQLPLMMAHGNPDGPLPHPHTPLYPVHALSQDKKNITQVNTIPFIPGKKQQPPTIAKTNIPAVYLCVIAMTSRFFI